MKEEEIFEASSNTMRPTRVWNKEQDPDQKQLHKEAEYQELLSELPKKFEEEKSK